MPKPPVNKRGGSKRGKFKPGKNSKGHGHSMTRATVRKKLKRD